MHAPSAPPGQIVFLNGVSSSGKTSIAEQLPGVLEEPWFHMPVDAVNGMRANRRTLELSPAELDVVLAGTRAGFHRAVAGMAAAWCTRMAAMTSNATPRPPARSTVP